MRLFTLEHGKAAYQADFVLYGTAILGMAGFLLLAGPRMQLLSIFSACLVGLAGWSAIEYAFHRFILHGLQPFSRWHAEHHHRPHALICTPTVLSAALIAALAFLPALLLSDLWRACGLTLGVLIGYFAYSVTHHATHHWRANSNWLRQRKRWHALHHRPLARPGHYGVTSSFWDHILRSAG